LESGKEKASNVAFLFPETLWNNLSQTLFNINTYCFGGLKVGRKNKGQGQKAVEFTGFSYCSFR